MRKTMFWLLSMFLFATLPALAQHHGNAGGGRVSNGGGHVAIPHSEPRVSGAQHGNVQRGDRAGRVERHDPSTFNHRGYHYDDGGARAHFNGGRFDHHFFADHWGFDHRFYWGHCNWYGPRFYVGSYFWYGGAYFVIVDDIPDFWYDDEVYVDYVDGYGYALINPVYPGIRYHVNVRF